MRVLHIDTGREMRGGQWQVLRLVAETAGETLLLAPKASPLFCMALEKGLRAAPLQISKLSSLAGSFDLIHAHDAHGHALAAALARTPLVVSRRVAFPVRRNRASRWKYAKAKHYIAVSQYVKGMLVEARIPLENISVVYDGVPLLAPSAGGNLIVAPATTDPAKGTALARKAADIAGVNLYLSDNLEKDLKLARIVLYITHDEGLGSAALLAMAAGVPVVASRVGGLPEIIEDERTGLLVENTPEMIAAAISRLLNDDVLRQRLASTGREAVQQRFSVSTMVRGTLDVYERILSC